MKKKIICFDIDGVICRTIKSNYIKSIPNKKAINMINILYESGYEIKIFTARYMGRNFDNFKKAQKMGYQKTFNQLKKWNLKFHKLILGKPTFDLFVDDKSLDFNKEWITTLKKKLKI